MRFSEVPGGPSRIDASAHAAGLRTQFFEVVEQLWPLSYPKSHPQEIGSEVLLLGEELATRGRLVWRLGRWAGRDGDSWLSSPQVCPIPRELLTHNSPTFSQMAGGLGNLIIHTFLPLAVVCSDTCVSPMRSWNSGQSG